MLDRNCRLCDQTRGTETELDPDDVCCIDSYRIYDSCRNQECIEDLPLLFTEEGQDVLERATAVRAKRVKVLWAKIDTEEMPFNRGYFQIQIRYYFAADLEVCLGHGNSEEITGLGISDKSVILYGGEGNVSIFESDIFPGFCPAQEALSVSASTNHPKAVVEVADPVALKLEVRCGCSSARNDLICNIDAIPQEIAYAFKGGFARTGSSDKTCYITIGLFSMVRTQRPAQLVIPACDFCIPEKTGEISLPYADPCALFRSMAFPINEFYPMRTRYAEDDQDACVNAQRERNDPCNCK